MCNSKKNRLIIITFNDTSWCLSSAFCATTILPTVKKSHLQAPVERNQIANVVLIFKTLLFQILVQSLNNTLAIDMSSLRFVVITYDI